MRKFEKLDVNVHCSSIDTVSRATTLHCFGLLVLQDVIVTPCVRREFYQIPVLGWEILSWLDLLCDCLLLWMDRISNLCNQRYCTWAVSVFGARKYFVPLLRRITYLSRLSLNFGRN